MAAEKLDMTVQNVSAQDHQLGKLLVYARLNPAGRGLTPKSPFEKLAQKFIGQLGWTGSEQAGLSEWVQLTGLVGGDAVLLQSLGQDLSWLQNVIAKKQPFGAVAHCLCEINP